MSKPQPAAAFETCFVAGLDLSEFGNSNHDNKTKPSPSHAAQLLTTTRLKAAERRATEQQEMTLAAAVQAKSRHVTTKLLEEATTTTKNAAHAALLHMHRQEKDGDPRHRLVAKKGPKTLSKRKNVVSAKHATSNKAGKRRGK